MLVCIHLHTLEELNWDHVNELTGWGEGYWVPASGGLGYHRLLQGAPGQVGQWQLRCLPLILRPTLPLSGLGLQNEPTKKLTFHLPMASGMLQ